MKISLSRSFVVPAVLVVVVHVGAFAKIEALPSRIGEADYCTFRSMERFVEDGRPGEGRGQLRDSLHLVADSVQ